MFNIDTDIHDIKELLDEFLQEIRDVLGILKKDYGFRYTASIEINNRLLRDIEINNDPMNIGHILMNDNPSSEVVVMEKNAQTYTYPTNPNMPISPPQYEQVSHAYQEIEAPPAPQVPQTNIINAWRILPDGRLEVVPGYYAKPISEPIVVDASTPQGDRYSPRNRYEMQAINPRSQVRLYSVIASPDVMNPAIKNIRRYMQEYQQIQQRQQMPQQQMPQQQMPQQQMPNIQSQKLKKNNNGLFKKAFQDVFVDEKGVLRKRSGDPIEYQVGVKDSLSKIGEVYGLEYNPQRHEFIKIPENNIFREARFIYLAPNGSSQGKVFPIRG
jgi:hypothetical protein